MEKTAPKTLSKHEKDLVKKIELETEKLNTNNLTRTKAYLDFFHNYPEIEWAFLAHMVSRNAGWNMTDLKGEFLSKILSSNEQKQFFLMLERGNWLIFQDAYPQLLLYAESKTADKPYFHLLSSFGVSRFMETVWTYYWKKRNGSLISIALIINEQNYIESRVIQNPKFEQSVLNTLEFKLQDTLNMNQILFPYKASRKNLILGQTVRHFDSLSNRIELGKNLYVILFNGPQTYTNVLDWASKTPHTASRKDFWPMVFNNYKETLPGGLYKPKLEHCKLEKNAPRIYSPSLHAAWKDIDHSNAKTEDWFQGDYQVIYELVNFPKYVDGEITKQYCSTLESLELILFAKEIIYHRSS